MLLLRSMKNLHANASPHCYCFWWSAWLFPLAIILNWYTHSLTTTKPCKGMPDTHFFFAFLLHAHQRVAWTMDLARMNVYLENNSRLLLKFISIFFLFGFLTWAGRSQVPLISSITLYTGGWGKNNKPARDRAFVHRDCWRKLQGLHQEHPYGWSGPTIERGC